jgi:uracil-DNA glycosylase family protein
MVPPAPPPIERPRTVRGKKRALAALRRAAADWRGCPLAKGATQIVFGAGPATARMIMIGEAPSTHEDRAGVPFVGPAGHILDAALEKAGLDREDLYVTNVEKFKHRRAGGRNTAPRTSEINFCRPWLEREIAIIQPEIIACLGALASKWVLGNDTSVMKCRGKWLSSPYAPHVLATIHPAYVLSRRDAASRERWERTLVADLRKVAHRYSK